MPNWATFYISIFAAFGIGGICLDWREKKPAWLLAGAFFSNLILVFLCICYWHPGLKTPLTGVAPAAFLGALLWELYQAKVDYRDTLSDWEVTPFDRKAMLIGLALLTLPALFIAGLASFR